MNAARIGSLCAGVGGLELGLEWAGIGETAWQVEIDQWCRSQLRRQWPKADQWDDIKTFAGAQAEVVCGGFPCQPFSKAGHQLGEADPRHLWPEFARIVRVVRPELVVLENVPPLLGLGMGSVLGDLAALGYDAQWDCIPAAAVGAPHGRDRVWVVAYPRRVGQLDAQPRIFPGKTWFPAQFDPESGRPIAHTRGRRQRTGQSDLRAGQPDLDGGGQALADLVRLGLQGGGLQDAGPAGETQRHGGPRGQERRGVGAAPGSPRSRVGRWLPEPPVGRVVHGLPDRLDWRRRIHAYGNAVVPQAAEYVGRLIVAAGLAPGGRSMTSAIEAGCKCPCGCLAANGPDPCRSCDPCPNVDGRET